jgi:hypothetical protein
MEDVSENGKQTLICNLQYILLLSVLWKWKLDEIIAK